MYIQHINHAKEGHLFKSMQSLWKYLMHIREPIQVNKHILLKSRHVHQKTNNTKSSQVNIHINIIEHIIKTTLSSSYNINKHA